jgi:hypothetical protein
MKEPAAVRPRMHSCSAWTDAGMCALWNPDRFTSVVDYDTWERELYADENLLRHVEHGDLVPINLGFDSAFGFSVRIGPLSEATLTEREGRYRFVSSDPYLYVSDGELCVSGLEHISADPEPQTATRVPLAPGRYQVIVHFLDWEAEPGALNQSGQPTAQALPDFVVLISPEPVPNPSYRVRLKTFEHPE